MKNLFKIINSEISLEEKLNYLIDNCKIETSYMSNMKYAIEQSKVDTSYSIEGNTIIKKLNDTPKGISNTVVWNLEHCIGEFVMQMEDNNELETAINNIHFLEDVISKMPTETDIQKLKKHIEYLESELFKWGGSNSMYERIE